jgi:hypothetical protein
MRVLPDGSVEAALRDATSLADARFVDFGIKDQDEEVGRIGFLLIEGPAAINLRARAILADLTGVHVVVTGTAAFSGLVDEQVQKILAGHG